MRRFQHFKTLFCKSLLLSNMQICDPRRKYKAKTIFFKFLKRSFLDHFAFHKKKQNTKSLDPYHIVVKPFKILKILKVSVKRI